MPFLGAKKCGFKLSKQNQLKAKSFVTYLSVTEETERVC